MSTSNIVDTYLLSPMQQGMLFHSLLDPESGVDIQQGLWSLCEELNIPAFQRAWKQVVSRHPALRTGFRWQDISDAQQLAIAKTLGTPMRLVRSAYCVAVNFLLVILAMKAA